MSLRLTLAAAAAAIATMSAVGANAAVLFSYPGATGELATDTSAVAVFNAPAGPANLTFTLDGFASLDGQNYYEDDFTLNLNGVDIASGTFNLGGGGVDAVYFAPLGATFNNISGNGTNVTWAGGQVNISTPLSLIAGLNTLTFSYSSLPGPNNAGFQGTGDEGWGLENIQVTNRVSVDGDPGGVPEPSTWGLLIAGFAGLGSMLRRQRRQLARVPA